MPLSDVETGFGTALHIDVGAGLVEVAEIIELPELPSGERGTYKTTHMKSVDFEEFKKLPLREGVELTIRGNYIIGSAAETTLDAADDADGALPYKIATAQDETVYNFTGDALFYNLRKLNPIDDRRTFEITMKPVSRPVKAGA